MKAKSTISEVNEKKIILKIDEFNSEFGYEIRISSGEQQLYIRRRNFGSISMRERNTILTDGLKQLLRFPSRCAQISAEDIYKPTNLALIGGANYILSYCTNKADYTLQKILRLPA